MISMTLKYLIENIYELRDQKIKSQEKHCGREDDWNDNHTRWKSSYI